MRRKGMWLRNSLRALGAASVVAAALVLPTGSAFASATCPVGWTATGTSDYPSCSRAIGTSTEAAYEAKLAAVTGQSSVDDQAVEYQVGTKGQPSSVYFSMSPAYTGADGPGSSYVYLSMYDSFGGNNGFNTFDDARAFATAQGINLDGGTVTLVDYGQDYASTMDPTLYPSPSAMAALSAVVGDSGAGPAFDPTDPTGAGDLTLMAQTWVANHGAPLVGGLVFIGAAFALLLKFLRRGTRAA